MQLGADSQRHLHRFRVRADLEGHVHRELLAHHHLTVGELRLTESRRRDLDIVETGLHVGEDESAGFIGGLRVENLGRLVRDRHFGAGNNGAAQVCDTPRHCSASGLPQEQGGEDHENH